MSKGLLIIMLVMFYNKAVTQTHGGFEQLYYSGNKGTSTIVPRVYYQNKKNWYAEVRYNYEEAETFSFNAGKTFSKDGKISYSVTPIAGAVAGKLNGALLGVNSEVEYNKLFFSSESQYTFSSRSRYADFLFNWSELGYQATSRIYTGLALQLTRFYKMTNVWEPGIMVGFSFDKFTFPLYTFSPLTNKRYFVLGINWEWQRQKNNNKKYEIPLLAKAGGPGT
jgi:hypothetical protein